MPTPFMKIVRCIGRKLTRATPMPPDGNKTYKRFQENLTPTLSVHKGVYLETFKKIKLFELRLCYDYVTHHLSSL
jgi:hypothetical protein